MMDDPKQEPVAAAPSNAAPVESDALARRDFLASLGKWSAAVIGGVALAGIFGLPRSAEAGGGWVNRRGGGGGGWANNRGGGGGGWVNGRGGGGGWVNGGGGGGGGGWVNRRGAGGGWVNNR